MGVNGAQKRTVRGELGNNQGDSAEAGRPGWALRDGCVEPGGKGRDAGGKAGGGLRSPPRDSPWGGRVGTPLV